jgi:hydroxypyruvate reductase
VTRYGHGLKPGEDAGAIQIVEAGHPSPDEASVAAGRRLLELAAGHAPDEQLFFLVSGGASALAAAPLAGIELNDKRDAANYLMHAGAGIREINCVRKHLSALKGGRLARAAQPVPVTTWAISDVPGDEIGAIGSGPTIPDRTTQAEAVGILRQYGYPRLEALLPILSDPVNETPKPDDPELTGHASRLIGTAAGAFAAAAALLEREGYEVLMLGDDLDTEAEYLGREHAALAREQLAAGRRVAILSGGETRVVVSKTGGRGGRNLVYLSGLALELAGQPGIYALAADTDGIDGHGDHAGGIVLPSTLSLGAERGVSLEALLAGHDSYTFFDACEL